MSKTLFQRISELFLTGILLTNATTACTPRQTISQNQTEQSSYVEQYGKDVGEKLDLLFSKRVDYRPFWGREMYDPEDKSFFIPTDPGSSSGREVGVVIPIEDLDWFADEYSIEEIARIADRPKIVNMLQKKEKREGLKEHERILIDNKNASHCQTSDGPIMIYPILNMENGEIERTLILYLYEAEFHNLSEEN